ncbi:MAG: hypothetical protein PG981_001434 [Wolbachia endosymbiont of Ctenocephalides orientis wCori]|nr:MAG: hypothetical protein PG981_001434 [Wolbachia endosymbiont of Ctenocephalides orientis wCori]
MIEKLTCIRVLIEYNKVIAVNKRKKAAVNKEGNFIEVNYGKEKGDKKTIKQ